MIWQAMCLNSVLTGMVQITMQSPEYNPTGPISGTMRIIRDGSWSYPPTRMRVSRRTEKHPASMLVCVGFRCIKSVVS